MSALRGPVRGLLVPLAAVEACPGEDFEVPPAGGPATDLLLVPGAAVDARPQQDSQVPPPRCRVAGFRTPRAATRSSPLQNVEVTSFGCLRSLTARAGSGRGSWRPRHRHALRLDRR